ncbi:unnamed protein product, partial [marine sediment metagenome]
DMVVLVGELHVDGLKELLAEKFPNVTIETSKDCSDSLGVIR